MKTTLARAAQKLILTLAITTAMTAVSVLPTYAAAGSGAGNDGGGGGGICINGKCMTLAEAGLRVEVPTSGGQIKIPTPAIPPSTFALYKSNLEQIIKQYDDFALIFNRLESYYVQSYERVAVYDPSALKAIRDQYIEVLRQNNFPSQNLELFAISSATRTYLLPEFFRLNERSQTLVIFHEELMKLYLKYAKDKYSATEALKIILSFDDGLVRMLNADYSASYNVARAFDLLGRVALATRQQEHLFHSTYLKALILKESRGEKYITLDARTGETLLAAGVMRLLPAQNPNLTYADIDFWQHFNKNYPELSRTLEFMGAKYVGGFVFDYSEYFVSYPYRKDLPDYICKKIVNGYFLTNARSELPDHSKLKVSGDKNSAYYQERALEAIYAGLCKDGRVLRYGLFEVSHAADEKSSSMSRNLLEHW